MAKTIIANYTSEGYPPEFLISILEQKYPHYTIDQLKTMNLPVGSYLLLSDGSMIHTPGGHNGAILYLIGTLSPSMKTKFFQEFSDHNNDNESLYKFFNKALGNAIRVYRAKYENETNVDINEPPTNLQLQTLDIIQNHFGCPLLTKVDDGNGISDVYVGSKKLHDLFYHEPEQKDETFPVSNSSLEEEPQRTTGIPYWKAIERQRLEKEYPGDDFGNKKTKELYEKGAMKKVS